MIRAVLLLAAVATLQAPTFHAEARLVVLHVSVRNARGEIVTTLDRDAFSVYENGKRQPITVFRRDDIPVSVGLLIDNSGSMRTLRPAVEAAALAFANASHPDDELFVVNFADKAQPRRAAHQRQGGAERSIARVDSIGGTAMRDAVEMAEGYLHDRGTQGPPGPAHHHRRDRQRERRISLDRVARAAEQRDVVIYVIGLLDTRTGSSETRPTKRSRNWPSGQAACRTRRRASDEVQGRRAGYRPTYPPPVHRGRIHQSTRLDGSYRTIQVKVRGRIATWRAPGQAIARRRRDRLGQGGWSPSFTARSSCAPHTLQMQLLTLFRLASQGAAAEHDADDADDARRHHRRQRRDLHDRHRRRRVVQDSRGHRQHRRQRGLGRGRRRQSRRRADGCGRDQVADARGHARDQGQVPLITHVSPIVDIARSWSTATRTGTRRCAASRPTICR